MKLEPPNWLRQEQALADEITSLRADLLTARRERDEASRTVERLRIALEKVQVWLPESGTVREALAATTPRAEPVVPTFKTTLMTLEDHMKELRNTVPLAEAEKLAKALEGALRTWHQPAKDWTDALAAYRTKHPPAEAKEEV